MAFIDNIRKYLKYKKVVVQFLEWHNFRILGLTQSKIAENSARCYT